MRVLHILPSHLYAIGGMEDFTRNLSLRLERHGIAVEIWHLPLRPGSMLMRDPPALSTRPLDVLTCARYRLPGFDPTRLRRFDLIHVHGIGGITDAVALSWPLHRRPIVVSTHGGIFHTRRLWRLKQWYFRLWQPLIARRVACYVACSVNDHDLFKPVVPRLELIENGVELFPASTVTKDPLRWVWVGRWSRNKELPALFRAVAAARRSLPSAHLDIVGAPDDLTRIDLDQVAQDSGLTGGVTIHEAVSRAELANVLARAGMTVSAARHEGFGLAVIEAMSAGCMPVVNDIPVFRRFVAEAGTGSTCDFADTEQAGNALCRAALSLRESDGRAYLRATAFAQRYAWSAVESRWLTLYRRLAAGAAHD
jgi:alpha-1,3-mannosyltransferase